MRFLDDLALRLGHALRAHPWVRVLAGALLIGIGILELVVGAGHGRLIAFGVLLVAGSLVAARSARLPSDHEEEPSDERPPSSGSDHDADLT